MTPAGARPGSTNRDGALVVERTGPLATVQDLGRPGLAHLGVTRSGAADRTALRRANRLVGNHQSAAAIEVTLGGLVVLALGDLTVAVTGATCPVLVDGRETAREAVLDVPSGSVVELGLAAAGVRAYLAVRGGVQTEPVLGSRACDTLARLGPRPLLTGDVLAIGHPNGPDVARWPRIAQVPVAALPDPDQVVTLDALPGPRADWLDDDGLTTLWQSTWTVSRHSDRVGLRCEGPSVTRAMTGELPSEGLVPGAIQVPPSGEPVVFLADHPVTGGYPVVAVLHGDQVDVAAQLRPGQRFRLHRRPQVVSPVH